ncbi:MAG: TetR/AcrR family transcriptional regulator [Myxococcales bacterium]|nr:TetR/AcrR family transcriptional regulator [Myxococcales bacterium]
MSHDQISARDQILSAAVQVLQEEGPAKLTQTRVAKAAGLRQGHLTYYFPRKADLWIATAARAHDEMEGQYAALATSTGVGESNTEVRSRLISLLTEIVRNHQRTRLLLSLALQAQEDPELLALCRENVKRSRGFLRSALGAHYSPLAVELTMATLWGLGMRELVTETGQDDCDTLNLIENLFVLLDKMSTMD